MGDGRWEMARRKKGEHRTAGLITAKNAENTKFKKHPTPNAARRTVQVCNSFVFFA
jgi:hypothetical protein